MMIWYVSVGTLPSLERAVVLHIDQVQQEAVVDAGAGPPVLVLSLLTRPGWRSHQYPCILLTRAGGHGKEGGEEQHPGWLHGVRCQGVTMLLWWSHWYTTHYHRWMLLL